MYLQYVRSFGQRENSRATLVYGIRPRCITDTRPGGLQPILKADGGCAKRREARAREAELALVEFSIADEGHVRGRRKLGTDR